MLARTIELATQGQLQQLSDRLTTPLLSSESQGRLFKILQSWQKTTEEILLFQHKQQVSNKLSSLRKKLEVKPEIISQLKLK